MKFKKNKLKNILLEIYLYLNFLIVFLNNRKINDGKIRVFYGGSLSGNLGGTLVKIKRLKSRFRNYFLKFNIVYLLSNSIYLNKISILNLKKKKIPIIHNQNGVFYEGWYGHGWKEKNEKMAFQLHNADYVFYQSNFSKFCSDKFLGKINSPNEILYNAVDINIFRPLKKKELKKELNFLVTGKYQDHLFYSLEYSIKLLSTLNKNGISSNISFAGYFENIVKKKILKLAEELKIENRISFVGQYFQENANQIYNAADIYLYFVHQSNCPNSILEAMATGLPIISVSTGGVPEIVDENCGVCLYSEPSWDKPTVPNIDEAVDGVKKILKDYSFFSDSCLKKVKKNHNFNDWINRHKEVFKEYL